VKPIISIVQVGDDLYHVLLSISDKVDISTVSDAAGVLLLVVRYLNAETDK